MELLFVTVLGAGLAIIVRYALPHRGTYGILLLPAIGIAVSAVTWVILLWIGLTFDGTWIWVASLTAAAAASVATALILPNTRKEADTRLFEELSQA